MSSQGGYLGRFKSSFRNWSTWSCPQKATLALTKSEANKSVCHSHLLVFMLSHIYTTSKTVMLVHQYTVKIDSHWKKNNKQTKNNRALCHSLCSSFIYLVIFSSHFLFLFFLFLVLFQPCVFSVSPHHHPQAASQIVIQPAHHFHLLVQSPRCSPFHSLLYVLHPVYTFSDHHPNSR